MPTFVSPGPSRRDLEPYSRPVPADTTRKGGSPEAQEPPGFARAKPRPARCRRSKPRLAPPLLRRSGPGSSQIRVLSPSGRANSWGAPHFWKALPVLVRSALGHRKPILKMRVSVIIHRRARGCLPNNRCASAPAEFFPVPEVLEIFWRHKIKNLACAADGSTMTIGRVLF